MLVEGGSELTEEKLRVRITPVWLCYTHVSCALSRSARKSNNYNSHPLRLVAVNSTIRYDTRCYFNVRSKADISQLNLPHGTDN